MRVKTPKYKGNMEQLLSPEQEADLINDLMVILEELNWQIAYKVDPNDSQEKIQGIIVGNTDFVNDILSSIDGKNSIDINEMFVGNTDELN